MDVVEPLVAEQGYAPEVTICSDEVAAGRPAPWQNFRATEGLGIYPMHRVLIVDDLLATGGTAAASCELVESLGADIIACAFLVELEGLGGRDRLDGRAIHSLLRYPA
jgi:orotate phosphoribosyltransferase-like protein